MLCYFLPCIPVSSCCISPVPCTAAVSHKIMYCLDFAMETGLCFGVSHVPWPQGSRLFHFRGSVLKFFLLLTFLLKSIGRETAL